MSIRKKTAFRFAIFGALAWLACWVLASHWIDIIRIFYGPYFAYDYQPAVLKSLHSLLDWLPLMAALALLALGVRTRNFLPGISFFAGALLSHMAVIAIFFGGPVVANYTSRTHFESEVWKRAEGSGDTIRGRMVDDLLRQRKLLGMLRSEIDELLGIPKQTAYFSDYGYVYWLGPERGLMGIDSEWLVLKFKDNRVIEARIVTD